MSKFFIGVKALIQNKKGEILLIKRSNKYKGCIGEVWDIPGGRIEFGEEPIDGLKREVMEETGIEIDKVKHILDTSTVYKNESKQIVRITYLASIKNENLKLSHEHTNNIWIRPKDIDFEIKDKLLEKAIKKLSSL